MPEKKFHPKRTLFVLFINGVLFFVILPLMTCRGICNSTQNRSFFILFLIAFLLTNLLVFSSLGIWSSYKDKPQK
ncbi:MAG: hypothetical protein V1824_01350 [archaeon]